jgi:hypothetical protein
MPHSLDDLLAQLLRRNRFPAQAHAGVIPGTLHATYQLRPFAPVLDPEKPSTPGVGAPHFGPLRWAISELCSVGTADRERLTRPIGGPAAGVYYVGSAPYVPPFKPWLMQAETTPPLEIPLPTFETHLYVLLPDGRLRVLAQRDAPHPQRDETYAPGEWPQPCQVAQELLYLYMAADICGFARLTKARPEMEIDSAYLRSTIPPGGVQRGPDVTRVGGPEPS